MSLSSEALDAIEAHAWPGNVRELENVVKRAVIMSDTSTITRGDIDIAPAATEGIALNLRQVREEAEAELREAAAGLKPEEAAVLGLLIGRLARQETRAARSGNGPSAQAAA